MSGALPAMAFKQCRRGVKQEREQQALGLGKLEGALEGTTVISATGARDEDLVRELGAIPVRYGPGLLTQVHAHAGKVDAVLDAAGIGGLGDAVVLAGGPARVIILAGEHAADFGVVLSAPTPDRAPDALDQTMPLLAAGKLRLRAQRFLPMKDAAQAHALLETGRAHHRLILTAG